MSPPPLLRVVGGLLRDGDRVLMTQRGPDGDFPLCWEFPGGKVEPDEDDAQALQRELREELDVEVGVGPRFLQVVHPSASRTLDLRVHTCVLLAGMPRCVGVFALRWVQIGGGVDESAGLSVPPADEPVLRRLRADAGLPAVTASGGSAAG